MNVEDFLKILKPTDMLISLLIISKPSGRKIKEANKNQEGSPDISNTWKSKIDSIRWAINCQSNDI